MAGALTIRCPKEILWHILFCALEPVGSYDGCAQYKIQTLLLLPAMVGHILFCVSGPLFDMVASHDARSDPPAIFCQARRIVSSTPWPLGAPRTRLFWGLTVSSRIVMNKMWVRSFQRTQILGGFKFQLQRVEPQGV